MIEQRKKNIFYFEDDMDCINDVVNILKEQYAITLAADWAAIKVKRKVPFDLVIIDLMIHRISSDESGQEVENITFEGISWKRTGLEFLRRIRQEEYEEYGFSKKAKVIIASAVVDHETKHDLHSLTISSYIEKPFTIEDIQEAIQKLIG